MIEVRGLARTFQTRKGPVEAVGGIDLHVARGEIVGLLGPNGAGKTTTQRMLATLLSPSAGKATIAGCDLRRDPVAVRRRIGYVAQGGGTNQAARVDEELVLQARLYGLTKQEAVRAAGDVRAQFDLSESRDKPIRILSGGQRRRLDIALGLVHSPEVLFLDEPSAGLDPQSRINLWSHVRSLGAQHNLSVLLTTHYLEEADALCDRILILDHGVIVAQGTPEELKRRISGDRVTLSMDGPTEVAKKLLAALPGVRDAIEIEQGVRITIEHGDEQILTLMRALDGAGVRVTALRVARPSLDDVFLSVTGRVLRDAETGRAA